MEDPNAKQLFSYSVKGGCIDGANADVMINFWIVAGAVPICNSCTKCLGSPGIVYDRTPDCHPVPSTRMHV